MKIGIRPVYGRIAAYSLLPLILVIFGTYAGMYLLSGSSLFVNLNQQYAGEELQHNLLITDQQASNLDHTFTSLEETSNLLKEQVYHVLSQKDSTTRKSYFHDITQDKPTPRPEFSSKYNKSVDFSVSSFFVSPVTAFGNYSTAVNQSIAQTSLLDIGFLSIYQTNADILWMQVFFNNSGIERTYPFNGPISNSYNPRNTTAFNLTSSVITNSFFYSNPFVDPFTNNTVISLTSGLYNENNTYLGYLSIKLLLNNVFDDLKLVADAQNTVFLVTSDLQTVFHSSFTHESQILNVSGSMQPIGLYESNTTKFDSLLSSATNNNVTYAVIKYENNGFNHLVAVKKVKGFIFGLAQIVQTTQVIGTFNLIELLIVPLTIIAAILVLMLILFKRYGFLRNIGINTLVALEQSVTSKVNAIANFEVEDIGELAKEKIEEKGEELREDVTNLDQKAQFVAQQIKNVDKITAAKLNEQLFSFENRLFSAIDKKFDNVEQLVQNAKGVISISSDQLRSLINDPEAYIARQLNIFGITSAKTPEEIADLPNEVNRLVAILLNVDRIDVTKMAELTKKKPENLRVIIGALPDSFGMKLEEPDVVISKKAIATNIPHFIQIYYQISPTENLSTQNTVGVASELGLGNVIDDLTVANQPADETDQSTEQSTETNDDARSSDESDSSQ